MNDKPETEKVTTLDTNSFLEQLILRIEEDMLKSELKDIAEKARELELKWKIGELSSEKVKIELLKLNDRQESIHHRLEDIQKMKQETEIEQFLNEVMLLMNKIEKLSKIRWKVGISQRFIDSLKRNLKSKIKENQELLKAFKSKFKEIKKNLEQKIKNLKLEKESLKASYLLNEISEDEYKKRDKELNKKIFIYQKALENLKSLKKQVSRVERYKWLI
ncbi:MAG: hypothetical protein J7L07_08670 [Candidatus Odinarchaeota archaeon]|nr:hypothetical protein [Candidatus Odinarchaeota archaeon]